MDAAKPHPQRLSIFAVTILEEAAVAARFAPIQPTVAHRLALAWLAYVGLSEDWRTAAFWKLLRRHDVAGRSDGQYRRDAEFANCLNGWRRMAGMPAKADWWR